MRKILIVILIGIISSSLAAILLMAINPDRIVALIIIICIGFGVVIGSIFWLISERSSYIRAVFKSGIIGFYPKGQKQYINELLKDLKKSKSLIIIAFRGLDLIGQQSDIGRTIVELQKVREEDKWKGKIEVYLSNPESEHIKMRVNGLKVEEDLYLGQLNNVIAFLGVLSQRYKINVSTCLYDEKPLCRAVILDRYAYVCLYDSVKQGKVTKSYKIRTTGSCLSSVIDLYLNYIKKISNPWDYNKVERGNGSNEKP